MTQQPYWEVPYMKGVEQHTIIKQAPHRRAAERGVPNHVGTAVECPPPASKKKSKKK